MHTSDLSRRDFMTLSVGALAGVGPSLAHAAAPTGNGRHEFDPRLTARPRRPSIEAIRGETSIGPDLDRAGFLYVPETYSEESPAPLIVALHGAGSGSSDLSHLQEVCETRGIVLMAPDSRGRTWDRVGGQFGPDVGFIDSALRYTFERCAIDPEHVAIAGFSDGASYALSLGVSNGDLFTHIIAWSPGFSDPEEPIVGTPRVFVSHGTADRVLPVAASRNAIVPMFQMDGYSVEYVEFEGRHEIPAAVSMKALDWFLR